MLYHVSKGVVRKKKKVAAKIEQYKKYFFQAGAGLINCES